MNTTIANRCTYDDLRQYLPPRVTRRQLMAASNTGRFPSYICLFDREPTWDKSEVMLWLEARALAPLKSEQVAA
jgi:hypothetical protein